MLLQHLRSIMPQEGSHGYLRDSLARHLLPALEQAADDETDLFSLGDLWFATSRSLLDLYVTNVPIDPAVRQILLGETMSRRILLLREELAAVECGEIAIKGVADSIRVARLQAKLQDLQKELDSFGPTIDRPADAARLAILFNEVHSFLNETMVQSKLDPLIQAVRSGHFQALQREDAFQLASTAFIRRLSANYNGLQDLIQPIVTAVNSAKFGMRCLARALQLRSSASTMDASIVTFPTVVAIENLNHTSGNFDNVSTQMLSAAAIAYEINLGRDQSSTLPALISHLNALYQTWSAGRLREERETQVAESLYKVKKTDVDVLYEEEQEAKEFGQLFPQYEDVDEPEKDGDLQPASSDAEVQAKFSADHMIAFHRLIVGVFGSTGSAVESGLLRDLVDVSVATSFRTLDFGEELDQGSSAFQIRQLHQRRAGTRISSNHPNFYLAPNEPEIRKAHALMTSLRSRLDALIDEWPEQMILQHIRDRCERVHSLGVGSPVALVLSALEQLLQHTNDWESYANRANSLKSFQQAASTLIIDWRKLELSSWMRLLDDQAEQYIAEDAEWTLRLYGALISGAISADDIDTHVETILPMITAYLSTSTIGHFSSRFSLLNYFEKMAAEISSSTVDKSGHLSAITTLIHNVTANAQLFSGRIRDALQTQRMVIDGSIKDYVKLASWKDVNVFALKASAQKSHRHLHSSIRKFRDVLRQSVAPILADSFSIFFQDVPLISDHQQGPVIDVSSLHPEVTQARLNVGDSVPRHLARLQDTLGKYHMVVTGRIYFSASGSELDAMAVGIIETAASLARATPATLTKDNSKMVTNLASRKRKAFADLLKALRASGFSQSVRSDLLLRQQSVTWLAARPLLVNGSLPESFETGNLQKIEGYHHRQAVLMTALRAALKGHNPDIASQDLQRGIGYTESLVSLALNERD